MAVFLILWETEGKIEYNLMLGECVIHAESAGFSSGNTSEIQVDGVEYSKQKRGLNIVLYHKLTGQVVESVQFDTCYGCEMTG